MALTVFAQVAASVLAAVAILVREVVGRGKLPLLVLAIALLIADAALTLWNAHSESRAEHCKQYSGLLRSETEAVGNQILVRSGGDLPSTLTAPPGGEFRMGVGDDILRIRLVDQRPVVTFPFRDSNGDIIGYIRDNEWHVSADQAYEHNFNDSALEVLGGKGEILLQVELLGEVVRIAGIFYSITGEATWRSSLPLGAGLDGRLFRYPSCRHPAELQD